MDIIDRSDEAMMREALREAVRAEVAGEVPVGAVIVCGGQIIARAHNLTERMNDATAHAEMQAITAAAHYLGGKYLNECTLYVTLEPCLMCAGALFWAQIGKVVYAAADPKRGYSRSGISVLHPRTVVVRGILESESSALLVNFFRNRRLKG